MSRRFFVLSRKLRAQLIMKTYMGRKILGAAVLLAALFAWSCKKDDPGEYTSGRGELTYDGNTYKLNRGLIWSLRMDVTDGAVYSNNLTIGNNDMTRVEFALFNTKSTPVAGTYAFGYNEEADSDKKAYYLKRFVNPVLYVDGTRVEGEVAVSGEVVVAAGGGDEYTVTGTVGYESGNEMEFSYTGRLDRPY